MIHGNEAEPLSDSLNVKTLTGQRVSKGLEISSDGDRERL